MKIALIDLDHPQTLQTARIDGLTQRELRAATWRGNDLLVRTASDSVLVLKGALVKLLAHPGYFLVLDDAPLPLAAFAPGLPQPSSYSAPHVPPFCFPLTISIGHSPSGRLGAQRAAALADEAWADHATALLASSAVEVAAPDLPSPALAAAGSHAPAEAPSFELTGECLFPSVQTSNASAIAAPAVTEPASALSSPWAWLGWTALAKVAHDVATRGNAVAQPAATTAGKASVPATDGSQDATNTAAADGSDIPASQDTAVAFTPTHAADLLAAALHAVPVIG
ncbi:hypothetical protein ACWA7J_16265 [Leptothrix sp. BB-4]